MQSSSLVGSGFNSTLSSSVDVILIDNFKYPFILVISSASGFAKATHKFFIQCFSFE